MRQNVFNSVIFGTNITVRIIINRLTTYINYECRYGLTEKAELSPFGSQNPMRNEILWSNITDCKEEWTLMGKIVRALSDDGSVLCSAIDSTR